MKYSVILLNYIRIILSVNFTMFLACLQKNENVADNNCIFYYFLGSCMKGYLLYF